MYTRSIVVYIRELVTVSEEVMLSGRVPKELKDLVDADRRSNQEILRVALWQEFGGEREAEIERRIDEKQDRINVVQNEMENRSEELRTLRNELEALQSRKDDVEQEERQERQNKLRKLKQVPNNPSHPLVQEVAQDLGIEPETALSEAEEL